MLLKAAAVCSCSNKRLELSRPAAPVRISFPCFFFCKKGPEQAPWPSGTWPRLDGRLQTGRRHKHTSARRCVWHWRPVTGATRGLPSCTSHTSYKPPPAPTSAPLNSLNAQLWKQTPDTKRPWPFAGNLYDYCIFRKRRTEVFQSFLCNLYLVITLLNISAAAYLKVPNSICTFHSSSQ